MVILKQIRRRKPMRFAILVQPGNQCQSGAAPDPQLVERMRKFNNQLAEAGVLVELARLNPTATRTRVKVTESGWTATDGPFAETKELLGGFWIWDCASREEAVEWIKRCPAMPGGEVEIREIIDPDPIAATFAARQALAHS
jgi:hypothetical protein